MRDRQYPVVALLALAVSAAGCKVKDPPPITAPFKDNFDRADLGSSWYATGDGYRMAQSALSAHNAHNHPLWLRAKLARNVRIELDCWSTEARGDLKVEVFGDGRSFDADGGHYEDQTGYELVFGGWYNTKSEIARLDEHGKDLAARSDIKVVPNKHYHWKVERSGKKITWWIDDMAPDKPFLSYEDPAPLDGNGHEYFAINNWETDTWFDNLVITPL
jgi:hypothetical protein